MIRIIYTILQQIENLKLKNNKIYSLCIGDLFLDRRLRDIFDGEWVYNPETTSIEIIRQVKESFDAINT